MSNSAPLVLLDDICERTELCDPSRMPDEAFRYVIDAEDRPRITDFGLARHLRDDFGVTITGQLLGSPNYMAPEQAVQTRNNVFYRNNGNHPKKWFLILFNHDFFKKQSVPVV